MEQQPNGSFLHLATMGLSRNNEIFYPTANWMVLAVKPGKWYLNSFMALSCQMTGVSCCPCMCRGRGFFGVRKSKLPD
jgi:hypothetical protein